MSTEEPENTAPMENSTASNTAPETPLDTAEEGTAPPAVDNTTTTATTINKVDYEEEAHKLEDKALRFLAKQTHPIIVPSFASWFDISTIHELEKRSVPDFFDDSSRFKSPKAYKDTRNFIINTYRLSPFEYLTITAVRRNIAMDVASIVKIHAFLEKWGLINYQIDPRSKPSLIGPSFTGHFQVILDTPQGLKPLIPSEVIPEEDSKKDEDGDISMEQSANDEENTMEKKVKFKPREEFPINLSLRKNVYDSTNDFNALQSHDRGSRQLHKTYVCHTCGNDTVLVRYHNLRAKDANLCSKCFQEGHFGANFQSSDFVRLENNSTSKIKKNWSDQEILLLLEGLEMYEDQWEKIVDHVGGSKSLEDCVEKFLSLPIEDKYIDDVIGNAKQTSSKLTTTSSSTQMDTVKAVDATIKSLLDGTHKDVLQESIPESAQKLSQKYLQETQSVALELVDVTLKKLELKYSKLLKLEVNLENERQRYIKETEKLSTDRLSLSKQVSEVNDELSKLNVSQRIVLASEQVDSGIKLVEKDQEVEEEKTQLQLKSDEKIEALSHSEPQTYKAWSL